METYPGKVILTGEHSVVYGSRILALALKNYTVKGELTSYEDSKNGNFLFKIKTEIQNISNFNISKQALLNIFNQNLWNNFNAIVNSKGLDSLVFAGDLLTELHLIIHSFKNRIGEVELTQEVINHFLFLTS